MKEACITHEKWGVRIRIHDFDLMFTRKLKSGIPHDKLFWNQDKREWHVRGEDNCIYALKQLNKYYSGGIDEVPNGHRFFWLTNFSKWREAFSSRKTYSYSQPDEEKTRNRENTSHSRKKHKKKHTKKKTKYKYPKSYRSACDLLGLDYNHSKREAKRAYRTKSKEHHPDRENGSKERMKQINAAWEKVKRRL